MGQFRSLLIQYNFYEMMHDFAELLYFIESVNLATRRSAKFNDKRLIFALLGENARVNRDFCFWRFLPLSVS